MGKVVPFPARDRPEISLYMEAYRLAFAALVASRDSLPEKFQRGFNKRLAAIPKEHRDAALHNLAGQMLSGAAAQQLSAAEEKLRNANSKALVPAALTPAP